MDKKNDEKEDKSAAWIAIGLGVGTAVGVALGQHRPGHCPGRGRWGGYVHQAKTSKRLIVGSHSMTQHLYYTDSYTTEFDAQILSITTVDGHPAALLDRSYFYPTSGGQQHDTGSLNGVAVVDVQVGKDGEILHILAAPLSPGPAHGVIDWPRRFDHMQQHTGQHLLSAAFTLRLNMETVSVHFGADICMLELDTDSVSDAQLAEIETVANYLVLTQLPVTAYEVDESRIAEIPLRRPPKVSGSIRIVEIQGFDWSACGGTHVRNTGEIGPIKLLRSERIRGHSRVHFLCGNRALADYTAKHNLLTATANLLDTRPEEVPDLVAKQMARLKEVERLVRDLQAAQVTFVAQDLLVAAPRENGVRMVLHRSPDLDPAGLKSLAQALTQQAGVIALLACESNGKATVLFARSADGDAHMGNLLRATLTHFGGSGGGRPDMAQGGGVDPETVGRGVGVCEGDVDQPVGARGGMAEECPQRKTISIAIPPHARHTYPYHRGRTAGHEVWRMENSPLNDKSCRHTSCPYATIHPIQTTRP